MGPPTSRGIGSASGTLLAGASGAALIVIMIPLAPSLIWVLPLLLLCGSLFLTPTWALIPGIVIAGFSSALVRLEVPAMAGVLGQGRVAAFLAGIAMLYTVTRRRDFRIPRATFVCAALYLASVFVSAIVAEARGNSDGVMRTLVQRELTQTVAPLLVGLIAFGHHRERIYALRALGLVTVMVCLLSVVYWAWYSADFVSLPKPVLSFFDVVRADAEDRGIARGRVAFPFVNTDPNSQSAIFAVLAAFSAAPLMSTKAGADRLLSLMVLLGCAVAIFTTGSRMGIILLLVIGVGYALLLTAVVGRGRMVLSLAILAGSLAVSLAVAMFLPEDRQFSTGDENLVSRTASWQGALDDFNSSPLYGHGLHYAAQGRYGTLSVHNEYLERLTDGGLIGGLAFVAVLAIMVVMSFETAKLQSLDGGVGAGGFAALGVVLVAMVPVAAWTGVPFLQILSWLIFGVVSSTWRAQRREVTREHARA